MEHIKVAIRVRPLLESEIDSYWSVADSQNIYQHASPSISFCYDRVFTSDEDTDAVYKESCGQIVQSVMKGFNGTIFAYGQTSSGKTYTMIGDNGIIPNSIKEIFTSIDDMPGREFLLRVSYLEIYNEVVSDLLNPEGRNLKLQETQAGVVTVVGLKEIEIKNQNDAYALLSTGNKSRRCGETQMNKKSSRSHVIFRMIIESRMYNEENNGDVTVAQLNMVDLAGSENSSQSGHHTGDRFKESVQINKSLLTLSMVIESLSKNSKNFVNFRNSKLTRILQNSLGGNSNTLMICTVAPTSVDQTLSTLKFAKRAKKIKNVAVANVVSTDQALLKRYSKQIQALTVKLSELQQPVGPHSEILKELDMKNQQNEDLKQQIETLKQKFVVSQFSIPVLPQPKSRSNRRETWCPSTSNRPNFGNFLPPMPILQEEEIATTNTTTDLDQGNSEIFTSTRNSFQDMISTSSQTDFNKAADDDKAKQIKKYMIEIAALRAANETLSTELSELKEFTTLERQLIVEEITLAVEDLKSKGEKTLRKSTGEVTYYDVVERLERSIQVSDSFGATYRPNQTQCFSPSVTKSCSYNTVGEQFTEMGDTFLAMGQSSKTTSEQSVQVVSTPVVNTCEMSVPNYVLHTCDKSVQLDNFIQSSDKSVQTDYVLESMSNKPEESTSNSQVSAIEAEIDHTLEKLNNNVKKLKSSNASFDAEVLQLTNSLSSLEDDTLTTLKETFRLKYEVIVKDLQYRTDSQKIGIEWRDAKIKKFTDLQLKHKDETQQLKNLYEHEKERAAKWKEDYLTSGKDFMEMKKKMQDDINMLFETVKVLKTRLEGKDEALKEMSRMLFVSKETLSSLRSLYAKKITDLTSECSSLKIQMFKDSKDHSLEVEQLKTSKKKSEMEFERKLLQLESEHKLAVLKARTEAGKNRDMFEENLQQSMSEFITRHSAATARPPQKENGSQTSFTTVDESQLKTDISDLNCVIDDLEKKLCTLDAQFNIVEDELTVSKSLESKLVSENQQLKDQIRTLSSRQVCDISTMTDNPYVGPQIVDREVSMCIEKWEKIVADAIPEWADPAMSEAEIKKMNLEMQKLQKRNKQLEEENETSQERILSYRNDIRRLNALHNDTFQEQRPSKTKSKSGDIPLAGRGGIVEEVTVMRLQALLHDREKVIVGLQKQNKKLQEKLRNDLDRGMELNENKNPNKVVMHKVSSAKQQLESKENVASGSHVEQTEKTMDLDKQVDNCKQQ